MNEQIRQIAARLRALREKRRLSQEEVARKIGLETEEYRKYEDARGDIPISVLYNAAAVFGVDPAEAMTGVAPQREDFAVSRQGQDILVRRHDNYAFHALTSGFKGRDMDPMIVVLKHTPEVELTSHPGQEFNYVLEGEIEVCIGAKRFTLAAGDSLYFNPSVPHGQRAVTPEARFLTVINERLITR